MSSCRSLRIISMKEAGWIARRVARQLGRSDCVAHLAPSLGTPVSSRTILRHLTERHLGLQRTHSCAALDVSVWSGAAHEETGLCNGRL
ncbi:hypothetical protein TNCV_3315081 [Trichonephila clavipes]|nr:hypothetical protein TNCV_3315081 [Trichonephila clavipes]